MVHHRTFLMPLLALLILSTPFNSLAKVDAPITAPPANVHAAFQAGGLKLDQDWTVGFDGALRVGLPWGLEFGGPLAIGYAPLRYNTGSGLMFALGVTDMWINENRELLWTPSAVIGAKIRVATTAAVYIAVDIAMVETGFGGTAHPTFMRGASALQVSMGPYFTWTFGISYQWVIVDAPPPSGLHRSGLAGNARVSIGSVRAAPFQDIPTFSIHTCKWLDIIISLRLDIDTDTDTTDSRFLGGLQVNLPFLSSQ